MSAKRIRDLQQRKKVLKDEATNIAAKAESENRDMTAEELATVDANIEKMTALDNQIRSLLALLDDESKPAAGARTDRTARGPPRGSYFEVPEGADISGGVAAMLQDPTFGFRHLGEFAAAVHRAGPNRAGIDERLETVASAPSVFGSESTGPDGGFLVPPEFGTDIMTYSFEQSSLMPFTDGYSLSRNSIVLPKDETTPWGTDGIRAFWENEAVAATATKPKLSTSTLRLHKLMSLIPITDELLEDGPVLGQYLGRKSGDSMRWKCNVAILNGTGNGQPIGANTGNAAMVIAKDSGQATQTLSATNLINMMKTQPEASFSRSIWLIHPDVLPALITLTIGNGIPIFLPFGNGAITQNPMDFDFEASPLVGRLLGRPVWATQLCAPFSSQGDVQLHDLKYYTSATKGGGVETASSMHLYFDAAAVAFRFMYRIDGQPRIVKPIADANGSGKRSPFLQLAAR